MPTLITTKKGVPVYQEDESTRTHWIAPAAIDADGANGQNGKPFAYRADNKGLDTNGNAGWPNKGWRNVLVEHNGKPLDDGNGNWYSATTYVWPNRPVAARYVDSATVPYIVVNPEVRRKTRGIVIGCKARASYKGRTVDCVVADVSGGADIGELSIAAAEALGIPSSPRTGGSANGVTFEMWPGIPAVVNGETYLLQKA